MGVDISDLVETKAITLEDLARRSIAIDAFNTLYQFLSMIRQPDGTPLMDREGRVTSHLSGLFFRSSALLEMGIRLAYVFDGEPPEQKRKTIEERIEAKVQAHKEWQEALEKGEIKRAFSRATRAASLSEGMVDESKDLLDAMGIPWIQAPSEGEAQMSHMVKKGDVWAGASQDFDALLFGTPTLVRNLTLAGKRRLPSGKKVDVTPELVTLSDVLGKLGITREQLIDMAILIGTDYNDGVKGIGPKKGLALIRESGSLRAVRDSGKVKAPIPEEWDEVREIFLSPEVTDDYSIVWGKVDAEGVRKVMCDKHGFGVDRIDNALSKLSAKGHVRSQQSLDSW